MIEIIGQPRDAMPEELEEALEVPKEETVPEWKERMLKVFLAGH